MEKLDTLMAVTRNSKLSKGAIRFKIVIEITSGWRKAHDNKLVRIRKYIFVGDASANLLMNRSKFYKKL